MQDIRFNPSRPVVGASTGRVLKLERKIPCQRGLIDLRRGNKKTVALTCPATGIPRRAKFDFSGGFRDVPYQFRPEKHDKTASLGILIKPKSAGFEGLFSVFNNFWHKLMVSPKQLAINIGIFTIVLFLSIGLVGQLRGIGRGLQVLAGIKEQVLMAYRQIVSGSSALADTDFAGSERHFGEAAVLLDEARKELNEALASSAIILHYADVTGTVRSGQELLDAGHHLSLAGQNISRGADLMVSRLGNKSFVAAMTQAKESLLIGISGLQQAEKSLNKVNSPILPPEIQEQVVKLKESIPIVTRILSEVSDQSDAFLTILGDKIDRQYLLVFQNNHELRPTGGFIGSVGVVNIDRGAVEAIDITSVYDPDGQLKETIAPPEPLRAIVDRWYMRDANWFVDWPVSARKIMEFYEKENGPTVDGVIALTPEVIRELLKVTGPIAVPEYGVKVDYENFWEVVQAQVSYEYDRQLNRPKQFLADLAPLLLNRLFSSPADSTLQVIEALTRMIKQKQLLLYFNNADLEQRLTQLGWDGRVPPDQMGFLAVNNANIGGHKSDQFMEQEIDYRLEMNPRGELEAIVTVRRTHQGPREASGYNYLEGENPTIKDNIVWQRVLVPLGAELLEARGFSPARAVPQFVELTDASLLQADNDLTRWQSGQVVDKSGTVIGREAGYTFFANWQITSPGETTVGIYRYRLPRRVKLPSTLDPAARLQAFVFKQPGETRTKIETEIKIPSEFAIAHAVPGEAAAQASGQSLVYRAPLVEDLLTGVVITRRSN